MQTSRRAFLFGRRAPRTPWDHFCQRMARSCAGALRDGGEAGDAAHASLAPAREADMLHARTLCREYGVTLALAGPGPQRPGPGRTLWARPGPGLDGLARLPGPAPAWRVGAGCTLDALRAAGLPQFEGLPGDMTVAAWLAGPASRPGPPGRGLAPGLLGAAVLLGDGTQESLGPFGAADGRPLRSATVQRLVSALFELCATPDAALCLAQPAWPARFRLDALRPADPGDVNLARLLAGHGGALAWVESVDLAPAAVGGRAQDAGDAGKSGGSAGAGKAGRIDGDDAAAAHARDGEAPADPAVRLAAGRLDLRVKALFDPFGLFPESGNA